MNKRIISAAAAAVALVLGTGAAGAQAKVGFVNSQRILAEAAGVQQVQQTLQRELGGLRAPLDTLEQQLQQGQQQLQQQGSTLSEQARTQRQEQLQQLYTQYQQRSQQAQQTAQRREAELLQPVMRQINEAIEAERRAGSYTYIIDSSGNGIVAVDPTVDLTDRVLARLGGTAGAAAPRP